MPIARNDPRRFTPRGLSDAYDSTDAFPGACRTLQNLIFDQANPEIMVARPGVGTALTTFASFTSPTFVSVFIQIGTMIYGMVSTSRNAGNDEPFAYNLATSSFVTISNVTAANTPASPTNGNLPWSPPTMAVVGTDILVTHPGFAGGTITASFTGAMSASSQLLTVSGAVTGTITLGMNVTGTNVPANSYIQSFGTGTGGDGTYFLNNAPSGAITAEAMTGTTKAKFGVLSIASPTSPFWQAADLAINALPSVPNAVANLNNRAYYACGNASYYSDVLAPTSATSAGQGITHGDTTPITSYNGMPVQQLSGGTLSTLMVFKGSQIWAISGDAALATLSNNPISNTLGTTIPRSVQQTPQGIYFIAIDGPYVIDLLGAIRPLTREPKESEQDVQVPFQNATYPTRGAAGFAGSIYRICVDTSIGGVASTNDYWFDTNRRKWTGPHTWPYDCIAQVSNYFIVSHRSKGAALYQSNVLPRTNSVYNDAGAALTSLLETASLPKDGRMAQRQVVESTVELSSGNLAIVFTVTALNDQRNVINQAYITTPSRGAQWGAFVWGMANWASAVSIPHVYNIPWTAPVVFQKMAVQVSATASSILAVGTQFHRFEDTGYTNAG